MTAQVAYLNAMDSLGVALALPVPSADAIANRYWNRALAEPVPRDRRAGALPLIID